MPILCQVCGAANPEDEEYCRRCRQKLMVISGVQPEAGDDGDEESLEESFSFDEHLLERISILEEAVKRTAETVRQLLGALRKQERNILINHAGLATARELLEQKALIDREQWDDLWGSKMDRQLLALEKRDRFGTIKDRIAALYHGDRRRVFLDRLEDAEYALYGFDMEAAVRSLEEAFKLDRGNYELAYFLGEIHFNESHPERALACFARVLEVKPDHYEGLVFTGVLYHEQGDNSRAEDYLKRAVSLYPDSFLPNFSLGAVYAGAGQLSRAAIFLERAVGIDAVPQAQFLLGRCLYEMGRLTGAIRALRETVRQDPAFEEAYHLLGLAYLDRHWHRKALDAFRSAQRLNPKKLAYHDLVRYLSGHLRAPLPVVEGQAAHWLEEGEKRLAREDLKGAHGCFRRALGVAPDNPTLLMSYAMLCLHLERDHEIEEVTRKILGSNPSEMLEATAYATLMAALRSQGKFREGNRIGRRLLAEDRSNFTKTIAYYEMAYNLAEMEEDLDEALGYARESLELSPEELRQFPLAALGWVHYKRKEYDQAVDFLARSSELGPSATTLTHLGMALLAAGEEERARGVLSHARSLSDRGTGLQEKLMTVMRDSGRLFERVRRGRKS
jgi:tetratricopeptide (TPR) repeat protein